MVPLHDGHTGERLQGKRKYTVHDLLCLLLLRCSEEAKGKEEKLLEDCFAVPLPQRRMTK